MWLGGGADRLVGVSHGSYHGSRTESKSFRWRVSLSEAKLELEPVPACRGVFSHVGGELIYFGVIFCNTEI